MRPLTADRIARAIHRVYDAGHAVEGCITTVPAWRVARAARTTLPRLRAFLESASGADTVGVLLDAQQPVTVEYFRAAHGCCAEVGLS